MGGGTGGPDSPLGNHKWLEVSLKILVLTPSQEAIGPKGSNCFSREVRMALCEIHYEDD